MRGKLRIKSDNATSGDQVQVGWIQEDGTESPNPAVRRFRYEIEGWGPPVVEAEIYDVDFESVVEVGTLSSFSTPELIEELRVRGFIPSGDPARN